MRRIKIEALADGWADDLLKWFEREPIAFAAYRVYRLLHQHGRVQSSPVPFVHRPWFAPLVLAYLVARRLVCLVATTPTVAGHVSVCHSGAPYKSDAFFGIIAALDGPTTLLATSGCRDRFDAVGDPAITSVVAFAPTFSSVSLRRLFGSLARLWTLAGEMAALLEVGSRRQRMLSFNFLVVEQAKYVGLAGCANGIRSPHTYSPMPYLLQAVPAEDIYVYQHGAHADTAGQRRSFVVPRHAPVRHLIWGEGWRGEFERKAHPESPIHA
ncbi:MAG: hypothetical protein RI568_16185, partial [Natronomonas sp.]|uniref:hypothetical protein n=1 Tax=Natronomonas sp. TaxID=2184060 RepID=UPI0028707681